MRIWSLPLLMLVLAGCQTTPSALPSAEPRPAPECRWSAGGADTESLLRRSVAALEAEGFTIRHTDLTLGLASGERTRTLPGYGGFHDPWWDRRGPFGHYIFAGGGRGGFSGGARVGFGAGYYGGMTRDAAELERVSVMVGEEVRVTRDIQLFDWRGELRQTRSGSVADFCLRLRQAIGTGGAS